VRQTDTLLIYGLFNDTVIISNDIMLNGQMIRKDTDDVLPEIELDTSQTQARSITA
jgi:hypothetical protein